MMDWVVRIFTWAWGIGLLCVSLYWLSQHPVALIAVLLLAGWLLWDWWHKKRRREREGWWVEWDQDKADHGDPPRYMTYHEGENTLKIDFHDGKLQVPPTPMKWDARMPVWARGRRDEIVSRIRQEYPRLVD